MTEQIGSLAEWSVMFGVIVQWRQHISSMHDGKALPQENSGNTHLSTPILHMTEIPQNSLSLLHEAIGNSAYLYRSGR